MTISLVIMILKIAFVSIAVGVVAIVIRWALLRALAFDRAVRDALSRRRSLMIDWHHRCSDPNCTVPSCMGMGFKRKLTFDDWNVLAGRLALKRKQHHDRDQSIDTLIEGCRKSNIDDETKG